VAKKGMAAMQNERKLKTNTQQDLSAPYPSRQKVALKSILTLEKTTYRFFGPQEKTVKQAK